MVTTTRKAETVDQARIRLAQQARDNGVKLRVDRMTGRWYATSASRRGLEHFCSATSCSCEGFAAHGRCQHHSAVLAAIGWIPSPLDSSSAA